MLRPLTTPQFAPFLEQNCAAVSGTQVQTFEMHDCVDGQVPQLAVCGPPQLLVAVTVPQLALCAAQKAVSV